MMSCFTTEAWSGGFYELAMEFGPCADQRLDEAVKAVWSVPGLEGCYLRPDVEPAEQQRIGPSLAAFESCGHLRGLATLPNGKQVACGMSPPIREEEGPIWIVLYVPMGALG